MIILRLDKVMADRKTSLNDLAAKVGISNVNLSNIKTGKISAIRFTTLNAICEALDCQPGDILEYQSESENAPEREACSECGTLNSVPYNFCKGCGKPSAPRL